MTENLNSAVAISVDLKKSRIRIYKSMIHLMGDPKYIQFLVNPNNKHVAIRGVDVSIPGDQAERIKSQYMAADNCFELYSKAFVNKLFDIIGSLDRSCTYKLSGIIVNSHNMAVFSLKTLVRVES